MPIENIPTKYYMHMPFPIKTVICAESLCKEYKNRVLFFAENWNLKGEAVCFFDVFGQIL